MLNLKDIIKKLNEDYEIISLRDNESFSLPFYVVVDNNVYPVVFIYTSSRLMPPDENSMTTFSVCGVYLFESDEINVFTKKSIEDFPIKSNTELFFSEFQKDSTISIMEEYDKTIALLNLVKYKSDVSIAIVKDLATSFNNIVPYGLKRFYFAIGQDYFQWVDSQIKLQTDSII
jgi:hypothetical protein